MNKFLARYTQEGVNKSILFDKTMFNQEDAEKYLSEKGIQNFLFFSEPNEPEPFGKDSMLFRGDIGFDITADNIMPHIMAGKNIILDSFGGDLWESWKIHDSIKALNLNPPIGAIGTVASAAVQILLSTENRWISPNSRGLIHEAWNMTMGNASDLRRSADVLEKENVQVAVLYSSVSGKTTEEIRALMKEEKFLNADEMIGLNFAKSKTSKFGDVEKQEVENKKDEEMNKEEKEQINSIGDKVNAIWNKLFPPKTEVKNIVIQDVNGTEIDFGEAIETKEQIAIGDTATVAGEPASGEFILEDGTTYVFEGGSLTEIKEPAEEVDEMEALRQENEALKAENETLKTESQNAIIKRDEVKAQLETEVKEVKKEFDTFKNKFSTEKAEINTPEKEGAEEGKPKFSYKRKE